MMHRVFTILVVVPLAILLIALAVANRMPVIFTLDPFDPGNPRLSVEVPLFALMFAALAIGLIVGSAITWLKQGRYRKVAREHRDDAGTKPARRDAALSGPTR